MNAFIAKNSDRHAAIILRTSLGVMYLSHSIALKLTTFGLTGTVSFFQSIGLPPAVAYVVISAEIVGGVMLIANIATAWVSLALIPILLGATWVHLPNGWVFSAQGGGWEYPVLLVLVSIAVALQSVSPRARGHGQLSAVSASSALTP